MKKILGRAITEEVDSEDIGQDSSSGESSASPQSCLSEAEPVAPSDFQ